MHPTPSLFVFFMASQKPISWLSAQLQYTCAFMVEDVAGSLLTVADIFGELSYEGFFARCCAYRPTKSGYDSRFCAAAASWNKRASMTSCSSEADMSMRHSQLFDHEFDSARQLQAHTKGIPFQRTLCRISLSRQQTQSQHRYTCASAVENAAVSSLSAADIFEK